MNEPEKYTDLPDPVVNSLIAKWNDPQMPLGTWLFYCHEAGIDPVRFRYTFEDFLVDREPFTSAGPEEALEHLAPAVEEFERLMEKHPEWFEEVEAQAQETTFRVYPFEPEYTIGDLLEGIEGPDRKPYVISAAVGAGLAVGVVYALRHSPSLLRAVVGKRAIGQTLRSYRS